MTITTVGLDLAKSLFQVHCIGSAGAVILRRKLRRSEVLGFFRSLGTVSGGNGGLRNRALLGSGDRRVGP